MNITFPWEFYRIKGVERLRRSMTVVHRPGTDGEFDIRIDDPDLATMFIVHRIQERFSRVNIELIKADKRTRVLMRGIQRSQDLAKAAFEVAPAFIIPALSHLTFREMYERLGRLLARVASDEDFEGAIVRQISEANVELGEGLALTSFRFEQAEAKQGAYAEAIEAYVETIIDGYAALLKAAEAITPKGYVFYESVSQGFRWQPDIDEMLKLFAGALPED